MTRIHTIRRAPNGHARAAPATRRGTFACTLLLCGAILALLAGCPRAFAAEVLGDLIQYVHTAWTDSPGLKGRINSIVQTSDGYLWLGTEFGLVRFDGIRFVPSGPGVGPPLPSSNTLSLLAARDGTPVGRHTGRARQLASGPTHSIPCARRNPCLLPAGGPRGHGVGGRGCRALRDSWNKSSVQ